MVHLADMKQGLLQENFLGNLETILVPETAIQFQFCG